MEFAADLPVSVERLAGGALCVTLNEGEILLDKGLIRCKSPFSGAVFARGVARWLGVSVPACNRDVPPSHVDVFVRSLGPIGEGDWRGLKLELRAGAHQASVYLNVEPSRGAGRLAEKDPAMRETLVALLLRATGDVAGLAAT